MTKRPLYLAGMVLLAVVLVTPLALAALPPGGTFIDDDGLEHEPNIEAIAALNITRGCSQDRFCPNSPVTCGQMAAFLNRALGLPATTVSPFTDSAGEFFDDINRLAAAGITRGCRATEFCPNAPVTRWQMAAFLNRALGLPATTVSPFTDSAGEFFDDINRLAAAGITLGCRATEFCPNAPVTRSDGDLPDPGSGSRSDCSTPPTPAGRRQPEWDRSDPDRGASRRRLQPGHRDRQRHTDRVHLTRGS